MCQQIAGKEISRANSTTPTLVTKLRHLYANAPHSRTQGFMVRTKIPVSTLLAKLRHLYANAPHSRTYLMKYGNLDFPFPVSTLLANWRSLRTLDLSHMSFRSLPDTIGLLLHLRYLDLYNNEYLKKLPKSLTKLINLQFLDLRECDELKELPKDLSKLVNLRTLYVHDGLEYMPLGMGRMTHLTRLNMFIADHRKSSLKLEGLRALRNLKGSLVIYPYGKYQLAKEYCGKGEYVCNTEHFNAIRIIWGIELNEEGSNDDDGEEDILEDLQPHTNLKELTLEGYGGVRMAGWAREDCLTTALPNLVKIYLNCFPELQELPWLGRLQHLKTLLLSQLKNVEYIENRGSIRSSSNDGAVVSNSSTTIESSVLFFPSLENLTLSYMPKLKGWWRGACNSASENVNSDSNMLTAPTHPLPSFPCLSNLTISGCPNMASIPLCPAMKELRLMHLNNGFRVEMLQSYGHAIILIL